MRRFSPGSLFVLLAVLGSIAPARAEVSDIMDQLMEQVFVLKPYMASESRFTDAANAGEISGALGTMTDLSRAVNHEERITQTGFQVPGALLTRQLEEIEVIFATGNKSYALTSLRSTLGVCMACHTQLPAVSTGFTEANEDKVLEDPFAEAEFLFLIRNFDAALKLYSEAIQGYPRNGAQPRALETALHRQLYYYTRVARDMEGLSATLRNDRGNPQLPAPFQQQVDGYIAAVDALGNEPYPRFTKQQDTALRSYAQAQIDEEASGGFNLGTPEKVLAWLQFSSVLYEYLDEHPQTPLKPDIYYWLSFGERRYIYSSPHFLPGLYLKQCVLDYPQSPVAKKCLAEYEEIVTVLFTGSGGTNIPPDVTDELDMMRTLVAGH